jgi:transcription elongation factor GreA
MTGTVYLTQEGYDKLKKELDHLERVERPGISQQIAEARDKGDLSENAEYDAAKEAQGMLEMKISELKTTLSNAKVLDESQVNTDEVRILNKVKLKNKKNNTIMQYLLVSESEADLKKGKISVSSPIGKALLGKKQGDEVDVQVPAGIIPFEILEISI